MAAEVSVETFLRFYLTLLPALENDIQQVKGKHLLHLPASGEPGLQVTTGLQRIND